MNPRFARCLSSSVLAAAVFAAGCATTKPPDVQYGPMCRATYAKLDEKVAAAGVRDVGYTPIAGFPYVRGDRFTSAFNDQLTDREIFWEWLTNLRVNDSDSRNVEMANLGFESDDRSRQLLDLRTCATWLSDFEMDDLKWRKRLIDTAQPPSDYSNGTRFWHFYPLAVGSLRDRLRKEQEETRKTFAKPIDQLDSPGPLVLWQPAADEELDKRPPPELAQSTRDRLDRMGLVLSDWDVLARAYAPRLWLETGGDYDKPGTPVPGKEGKSPKVDTAAPTMYYVVTYTRFGEQSMVQLVYFTWFSEHKATSEDDPSTGPLDGFVWRVTLDRKGNPLVFDSASASGLHHAWHPGRPLKTHPAADGDEPGFVPQSDPVPAAPIAVRLQSGTHALRRVVAVADAPASRTETYRLLPYEDLLMLPAQGGGTRSLFGPDGIVPGTGGKSSWALDATGIKSPGAMRQWGHHPIALIGQHHLDDIDVIARVFEVPEDVLASKPAKVVSEPAADIPTIPGFFPPMSEVPEGEGHSPAPPPPTTSN